MYEKLPQELKERGAFCLWKYEERDGSRTKVPYQTNGLCADSSNKVTFTDYAIAVRHRAAYDGIGIGVFGDICAIDIDSCVENGVLSDMAKDIITWMNTYTEYSPSGAGMRILFKASLPAYDEDDLHGESNSIVNQKAILKKYADDQNFPNTMYFVDDGYSGTNFNRPDWQRLIGIINEDKIGIIIVKDMSRLGRDYLQVGMYTEMLFPVHDIRFIAINNGVDSINGTEWVRCRSCPVCCSAPIAAQSCIRFVTGAGRTSRRFSFAPSTASIKECILRTRFTMFRWKKFYSGNFGSSLPMPVSMRKISFSWSHGGAVEIPVEAQEKTA